MGWKRVPRTRRGSIGIVLVPGMFGMSIGFRLQKWWLRFYGYRVVVVNIYPYGRPLCLGYLRGQGSADKRRWLFDYIDDAFIAARIATQQAQLRSRHCNTVIVMGFGYSGIQALRVRDVEGIIAWYPHLVFDQRSRKQPPDLTQLPCPAMLVYGATDQETKGSLAVRDAAVGAGMNIKTELVPRAGYAFAEWTWQYFILHAGYRFKASREAWAEVHLWLLNLMGG